MTIFKAAENEVESDDKEEGAARITLGNPLQ
jgi:hypothetical protein